MKNISLSAYSSYPLESKEVGVIVIQEWWGLDKHIKDLTLKFAENGYSSIAPDLYHNEVAHEPDEAQKLMMSMNFESALAEIGRAINILKRNCKKVVVSGFCMGGFLALKAGENFEVDGILSFYPGRYNPTSDDINKYKSPVKIFFGKDDQGYEEKKYKEIENTFKQNNKDFEIFLYDDAPHAYMNDTRQSYRENPSIDSWNIIIKFLDNLSYA